MIILGLTCMTDSAAFLIKDGKILGGIEEERFTRKKFQSGIPLHSIKYLLESNNINFSSVDVVSVYWNPFNILGRVIYLFKCIFTNPNLFSIKLKRSFKVFFGQHNDKSGWKDMFFLKKILKNRFGIYPKKIKYYDHHLCHIASAFYTSGFKESAILVMDGAGEAACTTLAYANGEKIKILYSINLPNSLGHFYSSVTSYLGFKMLEDEYKLMGLSSYGKPIYKDWILKNFLIKNDKGYSVDSNCLDYHRCLENDFKGSFIKKFGPARNKEEEITQYHKNIAASAQSAFEEIVIHLSKIIKKSTNSNNLCIVGGCGLNCTANGKVLENNIFKNLYVPPAPNDAGGSLGAAIIEQLNHKTFSNIKENLFPFNPYQGPQYSNKFIDNILSNYRNKINYKIIKNKDELIEEAVKSIINDKVICWFQGRMEFGPRALGARSFIADPRKKEIVDQINTQIKKREKFRPFAPSIKEEKIEQYFNTKQTSPYMTIIFKVLKKNKDLIKGVVHVDDTSRPQTVSKTFNEIYWELIDKFEKYTNVPVLLNTSFNVKEPIVCTPSEAVSTFLATDVKKLFLENYVLSKK